MSTININTYGPIISEKNIGDLIFTSIKKVLDSGDNVVIDFIGVISMATFCAKQIFGKLYLELGPELFFEKVDIKNASNDIRLMIKIGIQSAIDE